jgi:hypothetical protein
MRLSRRAAHRKRPVATRLPARLFTHNAAVDDILVLKEGAVVMFTKNDPGGRYVMAR